MTSGIYQIKCLANGRVYVGSSVNVEVRWSQHKSELRSGQHPNAWLQRAWNCYGANQFVFQTLQLHPELGLEVCEKSWIEHLSPNVFNVNMDPTSPPMRGKKMSEASRLALSKSLKEHYVDKPGNRRGVKMSEEAKEAISKALKEHYKDKPGNRRGAKMPEEAVRLMRNRLKGNAHRRGKSASADDKLKMKLAQLERWKTYVVSEETRAKLRAHPRSALTEEQKRKIGAGQKAHQAKYGNPMSGKKRPDLSERNRVSKVR